MGTMDKNKSIIIGVVIVVVVVVALVYISKQGQPVPNLNPTPTPGTTTTQPEAATTTPQTQPQTRIDVPENVVVPTRGATNTPANVAVPTVVGPAGPSTKSSFRRFEVKVDNNKFVPDTVNAIAGDNIQIDFTAVDKEYDFTQPDYGFPKVPLPKGKSKPIAFQVTATGQFLFYCTACGGPTSGPVGKINVVAAK